MRVGPVGVSDSDIIPLRPNSMLLQVCTGKNFDCLAALMFFRLAYWRSCEENIRRPQGISRYLMVDQF